MTLQEINVMMQSIVDTAGLVDYAYYKFGEGTNPELPYAIFYYPNSDNESADSGVWADISALNIELYTANKDFAKEQLLESVLKSHGFFFNKTETYLNDEKMYEVLYQMEVVIDG